MKGLCKGRQEEVWLGLAGVLRLGISSALADYQPRRITRGAQTDALRLKRRRRNPPILARPPIPFPLSHGVHPTKAIVHPTKKQPSFRRTHDKSKTVFRFFTKKTSPICETPPSSSPEDPISASGYADSSE